MVYKKVIYSMYNDDENKCKLYNFFNSHASNLMTKMRHPCFYIKEFFIELRTHSR